MGIPIIYQKRDFGTFGQRDSTRSIFVDEKLSNQIIAKDEDELDILIKEIQVLISRFEEFIKRNKITEIRNRNDFLSAQYLKDPDYNFHEILSQLNERFRRLFSAFISDVALILKKIEESKSASKQEIHTEILKISHLMGIARSIADEQVKIAKYNKKKSREIVENLRQELNDSYKKIENLRNILTSIQTSDESINERKYKIPIKLRFLALMNAEVSDRSLFIKESKLENDISNILDEFEKTRQRYEQMIESVGDDKGKYHSQHILLADSEKEVYDLSLKLFEFISWLKNNIINLLQLYLDHIQNTTHIETELEIDEIKKLSKVRDYFNFLIYLPPLFRELLNADDDIKKLRELLVNVAVYSEEGLKQDIILDNEVRELENELKKLDNSLWEEENLLEKIKDQIQHFDIIPRELNIPGPNDTIISGDIYIKDPEYKPKIGIITIPGIANPRRIYHPTAIRAAQMGFLVYCADMPAHGYSVGDWSFGNCSENFLNVIRYLKKEYNLEKIGIIGFSLGAMASLFTLMHFTTAIGDAMEKFDKFLIKFSKKNINYEKLFEEIIITNLISELKSYSERIQNELKNIKFKKKLISRESETYNSIIIYVSNYEEFFKMELIAANKLIKNVNYIEDEKINKFRKYDSSDDFTEDIAKSFNDINSYMDAIKIPSELAEPLLREVEKVIVKSNFNRDINNLFSSCRNTLDSAQKIRAKLKNESDGIIKKLRTIDPNDSGLNSLKDYYKEELRSLVITDYEKYRDCKIDAMFLLSPVDYPQKTMPIRQIESLFGKIGKPEWYPPFVDLLFFIFYREFSRKKAETGPDEQIPPGSRFYFKKNPYIKSVQDKFEENSLFKSMVKHLKLTFLTVGEDPVQIGAIKSWSREKLKRGLMGPSQFQYLALMEELYPEVLTEIKNVPKIAVFGENDRIIKFRERERDLVKSFEEFGNIRISVLNGLDHDFDFAGDKHNLYVNPVFAKYVYDFFLLLSQS